MEQATALDACDTLKDDNPPRATPYFSAPVLSYLKDIYECLSSVDPKPDFVNDIQKEAIVSSESESNGSPLASLSSFLGYMASTAGKANRPAEVPDLSAPISSYFISSSHNTYLTGNQLYSDASTDAYKEVLSRGCRCLEIDVWDGVSMPSGLTDSSSNPSSSSSSSSDAEKRVTVKSISRSFSQLVKRAPSIRSHKTAKKPNVTPEVVKTTGEAVIALPEPRVLHGYTLTKEITFRDVCHTIRDNAFTKSELPIIVSLEVHACLEQQKIMVEIMRDVWRGLLIDIISDVDVTSCVLPYLKNLKRKILIKVKWAPPSPKVAEGDGQLDDILEQSKTNALAAKDDKLATTVSAPKKEKPSKVLQALSELAIYTKAYHFSDFTQAEATIPTHVFSLSEAAVKDAHESERDALLNHNRRYLMRVFPSGIRVNSSNLDPTFSWQQGAQMVALNWQSCDKGMMLNDAMFADGQGWMKKPRLYREISETGTDANDVDDDRRTIDLTIEIFAGYQLPLPLDDTSLSTNNFHPYVNCQLHLCQIELQSPSATVADKDKSSAVTSKSTKSKLRTRTCHGIDPDFGRETLTFPTATNVVEELSFVRFKIQDDVFGRDKLAAWACIRLDRLRQGYRLLHLQDAAGRASGGVLLVKIDKKIS